MAVLHIGKNKEYDIKLYHITTMVLLLIIIILDNIVLRQMIPVLCILISTRGSIYAVAWDCKICYFYTSYFNVPNLIFPIPTINASVYSAFGDYCSNAYFMLSKNQQQKNDISFSIDTRS